MMRLACGLNLSGIVIREFCKGGSCLSVGVISWMMVVLLHGGATGRLVRWGDCWVKRWDGKINASVLSLGVWNTSK